jgi:hypothetical protein
MTSFEKKHETDIFGRLEGFDRIIFRGYLQSFFTPKGFGYFLNHENVLLKDYGRYVKSVTNGIKSQIEKIVQETGCKEQYLNGSEKKSKEEIAKVIQQENNIRKGIICILSQVEPCYSFNVKGNHLTHKLEIRHEYRKCLHYYFYYCDKEFGLMHVRMQSWFPFEIQIYINGREYLKTQLDKENIKYESFDNSITWCEDLERAQKILDKLKEKKLQATFDAFAYKINPFIEKITQILGRGYYWCLHQCEYATDILFKSREKLEEIYPFLMEHSSLKLMGEDIFTFFGRKIIANTQGEAVSDRKKFVQGIRVKYRLDKNSLKVYDKYSVLRIETTINNPKVFKIFKEVTRSGQQVQRWVPMGKGISNIYRYAEVSSNCNNRLLEQLSHANDGDQTLEFNKTIEKLSNPVETKLSEKSENSRVFGKFNLLRNDTCIIFNAIFNGSFLITGFQNKHLKECLTKEGYFSNQELLFPKKITAKVSRIIAKLRAHKLVYKVANSCKYYLVKKAKETICEILSFKKLHLKTA